MAEAIRGIPHESDNPSFMNEIMQLQESERELATLTDQHSEAKTAAAQAEARVVDTDQARVEGFEKARRARVDLGIAIARDESIDPIQRAIWARSFELFNKVADPINFAIEQESLIDRTAEKLQPGALILEVKPRSISLTKIETAGLTTDLQVREAPSWIKAKGQEHEVVGGNVETHPAHRITVDFGHQILGDEEFSSKDMPIMLRYWADGDGEGRANRYLDDNSSTLLGEDKIREYVFDVILPSESKYTDAELNRRFWVFVIAKKLGCEFPAAIQDHLVFQNWRDGAQSAIAESLQKLAAGEHTYDTNDSGRRHAVEIEEVHGMETWDKEYLDAMMSAFNITPEMVKAKVIDNLSGEVANAQAASRKITILSNLDKILDTLFQ